MQIKPPGLFTRGKIILGRPAPHITPDTLLYELSQAWAPRGFSVYKSALIGLDVALKKSGWTGVAIKIKHKDGVTELAYNAFAPSAFVRVMAMGLIPILIVNATSWKPLLREFEKYIQSSPYFAGGFLPGGHAQLPPGAGPPMHGQPMHGQPMQQMPGMHGQQPMHGQPMQQVQQAPASAACGQCGAHMQWVAQHQRWYCGACQQYR